MEHEKCSNSECFIGNTSEVDRRKRELSSIKSLRIGTTAYDIHGMRILNSECKPMFIDKTDMNKYDNIMMTSMRNIRRGVK